MRPCAESRPLIEIPQGSRRRLQSRTPEPEQQVATPDPLPVLASPAAGNGRPRAKERAEAFVREQLAYGPRHGDLVKRDAAEYAKISERTLIAAAERLGVRTQRGQWWLPPA